jgi:hypothetical protein
MVYYEKETISGDENRPILQQQEAGKSVKDITKGHGISEAAFYYRKAKYFGVQVQYTIPYHS